MLFPLISTVFTVYRRSTRPGYTTLRFAALTPLLHMAFTTTTRKRLLFVDDEEGIRLTLPPLLEQQGFEVRVAATVPEALVEINSYPFDVLITDLNIGAQGDGFLVISAMRHLQPRCVNLILTGYPALETALEALRAQVDDYLVKPVDLEAMLGTIDGKLSDRAAKLVQAADKVA